LVAAMTIQDLRRRLLSPWLVFGVLLTLPVLVPQLQWLLEHAPSGHLVRGETELSLSDNARRIGKGMFRLIVSIVGFLVPLWVLWLAVFWKAVRRPPAVTAERAVPVQLFQRLFFVLVGLAAIAIAIIQSDRLRSHYMFVLIPLVPYFFLRYGPAFRDKEIQRFAAIVSIAGVALIGTLIGKYLLEPLVCGHCEDHIPYATFAQKIRNAGFKQGTIFAYFHRDPLAGNFRVQFKDSRVVSAKHPKVIAPRKHPAGQCLIVWPVRGAKEPKSATIRTANASALKTGLALDHPAVTITAQLPPYGRKPHQLAFVLLNEGAGECR